MGDNVVKHKSQDIIQTLITTAIYNKTLFILLSDILNHSVSY